MLSSGPCGPCVCLHGLHGRRDVRRLKLVVVSTYVKYVSGYIAVRLCVTCMCTGESGYGLDVPVYVHVSAGCRHVLASVYMHLSVCRQ